jgi:hypothetical protein
MAPCKCSTPTGNRKPTRRARWITAARHYWLFAGQRLENKFRLDLDCRLQAAVNRTTIGEESVHALYGLTLGLVRFEAQLDVNSFNDQDIVFQLDFAHRCSDQAFIRRIDFTRLQRAPEGSGKSTGSGCDDII